MELLLILKSLYPVRVVDIVGSLPPNVTNYIAPSKAVEQISYAMGVLITLGAIAATGFIIKGGLDYAMSSGDPSKVKTAQATVQYAVIGLVVAIAAFAILQVVKGTLGIGDLNLEL